MRITVPRPAAACYNNIAVPRVALRVLGGDTHSVRLVVYTILYTPYSV